MLFRRPGATSVVSEKLAVRRSVEIEPRKLLRVGRNAPCPCGSGKKYKACHESEGDAFLVKLAQRKERERREEEQRKAGVPWFRRWLDRTLHQ